MSAERSIQGLDGLGKVDLKSKAKTRIELNFLNAMTELVDPNNNLAKVASLIQEGAYPIFYANHTQHANVAGFRTVHNSLGVSQPENLYIAIAHSLINDGQDEKLIKFARAAGPMFQKEGMQFVPLIRPQDLEKIAEDNTGWRHDPEVKQKVHEHSSNMKYIERTFEASGAGLAFFPEATTTGGTKTEEGERVGMIEVKHRMFADLILAAKKAKRDLVFIPLGMNGFNTIVEPRTSKYPKKVLWWGVRESAADRLSINSRKKPSQVVVGEPFTLEDLMSSGIVNLSEEKRRFTPEEVAVINPYMMKKIAPLVEPELQGVYKEAV